MSSATGTSCISDLPSSALALSMRAGCVSRCPGCRNTHELYGASLDRKTRSLQDTLSSFKDRIEPFHFNPNPFDYRRKALLFPNAHGEWGLRKAVPGTYDLEVIPIPECPVHSPAVRESVHELMRLRPHLEGLPVFAALILEDRVGLVLKSKPIELPRELQEARFKSLWACFHPSAGDRVLDRRGWVQIFGPFDWKDESDHWVSFGAFTQQRLGLHAQSLQFAREFLSSSPALLDLYSGTGRSLAGFVGKEVLAVELDSFGIACAKKNAPHATLLQGKAEHRVPQLREWLGTRAQCAAFLNPPRTGVHPNVLQLLCESPSLKRMAYLSCSSRSLDRDLRSLSGNWGVQKIIPFDFFPWAAHYEVLALLERP